MKEVLQVAAIGMDTRVRGHSHDDYRGCDSHTSATELLVYWFVNCDILVVSKFLKSSSSSIC